MGSKPDIIREIIFNEDFNVLFDKTVSPVLLEACAAIESKDDINLKKPVGIPEKADNPSCLCCRVFFSTTKQQREHYRLDWHRYNLKQSLQSKPPIGEEDFNNKTENDEVSTISGSDSEEEEQDALDKFATAQGKIFLQNRNGQVFSMYRCVLLVNRQEELSTVNFYERFKENCYNNKQWAIIMLGGGHFAGAIFDYLTPVVHNTFHCYTVRAGQGGSQSARDNKSGGVHSKSAGASLRRHNAQALTDYVRNILTNWSEDLKKSSLIFYRASGPYNRGMLFGGKQPLLQRSDPRLRTIPFSTGRATFTEVKRVHLEICSAPVYASLSDVADQFSKHKSPEKNAKRNKARSSCINRSKSRELVERQLPSEMNHGSSEENISTVDLIKLKPERLSEHSDVEIVLNSASLEISLEDLKEFDDSLTSEQRTRGHYRKKNRKSKNQKFKQKEEGRKKKIIDILVKGNIVLLEELMQVHLKIFVEGSNVSRDDIAQDLFNEILDEQGNSFLHLAAMNEHEDMLRYLLDNAADPCLKNQNQQTPYSCTNSKISRDTFRKFAKENPDKYNYKKAQIPTHFLTDEEMEEKKRVQRQLKREREKEKKKVNHLREKEEQEKNRFLNLSDREKRALAAERRILNTKGKIISRCFLCGADMEGKVPFEYLENRFCSIDCLKSHRLKITNKS